MKKKVAFSIIFILLSLALCLFVANEYLKRVEVKTIDNYLSKVQDEFKNYDLNIATSPTTCYGFIKHHCHIAKLEITHKDSKINLENIKLTITQATPRQIGVEIQINQISHNLTRNPYSAFIPQNIIYSLDLKKEDSALGYVMLGRKLYLDFNKFDMEIDFEILLREKLFRNKNIIFLIKEWFDTTTPSFYEYSLDNLFLYIKAKQINTFNFSLWSAIESLKEDIQKKSKNPFLSKVFNQLVISFYQLLDGRLKAIDVAITRKNDKLIFFNILSKKASTEKILEIEEVLDSINPTYRIILNKQ